MSESLSMIDVEIEVDVFRKLFIPAKALNKECILRFTESKLEVPVDDPANVAYADISLGSGAFSKYDVSDEQVEIGVEIEEIRRAFKFANKSAFVSLRYDPESNLLNIDVDGQESQIATISPDKTVKTQPELDVDYTSKVILPGSEFNQGIKIASEFSDYVLIYIKEDDRSFRMRAQGDINFTERTVSEEDLESIDVGTASGVYSLGYLNELLGAIDDDVSVHLKLAKEDRPMDIDFTFADGHGSVNILIAPRIQSDTSADKSPEV